MSTSVARSASASTATTYHAGRLLIGQQPRADDGRHRRGLPRQHRHRPADHVSSTRSTRRTRREMIAQILGVPFLGFAFTIAIGSPLLDYIGMRLLLPLSAVSLHRSARCSCSSAGSIATGSGIYTDALGRGAPHGHRLGARRDGHQSADRGALSDGTRPTKLNLLHAWWPGGLVIGGLLGVAMTAAVSAGRPSSRRADSGHRRHRPQPAASRIRRPSARPPASRWERCSASSSSRSSSCCSCRCS